MLDKGSAGVFSSVKKVPRDAEIIQPHLQEMIRAQDALSTLAEMTDAQVIDFYHSLQKTKTSEKKNEGVDVPFCLGAVVVLKGPVDRPEIEISLVR